MSTPTNTDILEQLRAINERLAHIETDLKSMREELAEKRQLEVADEEALDRRLAAAAERLAPFYAAGSELNVWESIEGEDFYDYEEK